MSTKLFVALCGAVTIAWLPSAGAQDDEERQISSEPLQCLSMTSIRSTRVVDDSTVLFFQSRRVYVNRLERECLGLTRSGRFTYQVQTGARQARLCATDSITVLESTGRGFNCGLGKFREVSREEADAFLIGPNRAVTSTQVELPKSEEPAPPAKQ
ncbi:MAG TPA: hypothetical protein VM692_04065 [Gammaproteobacteria bacterium]|nr:hypothetical protein [Gammaproteobacteria bacterium]